MAARSKKRSSKSENKLLKLEFLQLSDVLCSICQSVLIEPVTLPCFHNFCLECFNGNIEYNALCCPLCRNRIGSWLRTKTKQNNLINKQLWQYLKVNFCNEVTKRLNGEDVDIPEEKPKLRLSAPGEIRIEYENELKRLKEERLLLEAKHSHETESLIKKIQEEEQRAHKEYLERLKQDEELARELASVNQSKTKLSDNLGNENKNGQLKTLDSFIIKNKAKCKVPSEQNKNDSLLSESKNDSEEKKSDTQKPNGIVKHQSSPELVPSYGKFLKSYLDRKFRHVTGAHSSKEIRNIASCSKQEPSEVVRAAVRRLSAGTESSADSVRQELCYFKPINASTTTKSNVIRQPVRVLAVRGTPADDVHPKAPSCAKSKCLRNPDAPSAFVCLTTPIEMKKAECDSSNTSYSKKTAIIKPMISENYKYRLRPKVRKSSSTGNLNKLEVTPKKYEKATKKRKAVSEGKKRKTPDSFIGTPAKRNNRRTCASKNLLNFEDNNNMFSPKKCDDYFDLSPLKMDKEIIAQQRELERRIEQEKKDLELALALQQEVIAPPHRKRIKL